MLRILSFTVARSQLLKHVYEHSYSTQLALPLPTFCVLQQSHACVLVHEIWNAHLNTFSRVINHPRYQPHTLSSHLRHHSSHHCCSS